MYQGARTDDTFVPITWGSSIDALTPKTPLRPTILDVPAHMDWAAVELPDPETPVGARGIGSSFLSQLGAAPC